MADTDIASTVTLWHCPQCAFGYDAVHTLADGSHRCPLCELTAVETELRTARAQIAELEPRITELELIVTDLNEERIDLRRQLEEARLQLQVSDKVIANLHMQLAEARNEQRQDPPWVRAQQCPVPPLPCTCSRDDMLPEECVTHGRRGR